MDGREKRREFPRRLCIYLVHVKYAKLSLKILFIQVSNKCVYEGNLLSELTYPRPYPARDIRLVDFSIPKRSDIDQ
jgi:hypothetical protein